MSCYDALARWYDSLTGDVPYADIADLYEAEFAADGGEFRLLLDLCCGTGSMTWELAQRGYEMIAADRSVDMLMEAQGKQFEVGTRPLFLCQSAEELDLYGTVDAAVCCLDGLNYIPADSLPEANKVELSRCRIDVVNNFHARMLSSAILAARNDWLEYVQVVSFGCGHDAYLSDEIIRLMLGDGPTDAEIDHMSE